MTTTLAGIERLEHACVDAMSRSDCSRLQFNELAETLEKVRGLKSRYLAEHPTVLRKGAAKLHTAPLDRDRPTAPSPDALLDAPLAFRAPPDLVGVVVHTVAGMIRVPDGGIVEAAAHHHALHAELIGRGFRLVVSYVKPNPDPLMFGADGGTDPKR